jgi:hypothetical protein
MKFDCSFKELEKLPRSPKIIHGSFFLRGYNSSINLKNSPQTVEENFHCYHNRLTSLYGISRFIGGHLYGEFNRLSNLIYGPKIITSISIKYNHLLSLDYSNTRNLWK